MSSSASIPSSLSQALRIARWLIDEAGTAPVHLFAVATAQAEDGPDVEKPLTNVGIPTRNIILESELLTSARRLVLQMDSRQGAIAETLSRHRFGDDAHGWKRRLESFSNSVFLFSLLFWA